VTRDAVLDHDVDLLSYTLMSSGPAALTGPRAADLRTLLASLANNDVATIWASYLEPQAVAAGVPAEIVSFLGDRMLGNDPAALVDMARHLLSAVDRTDELAKLGDLPKLVIYGQNDNAWLPTVQEEMALNLSASRVCIPGAMHSPNVEAPATTASALTTFWDQAE
jgi:pimeloyl-ACP methyl ester carboxylesterase